MTRVQVLARGAGGPGGAKALLRCSSGRMRWFVGVVLAIRYRTAEGRGDTWIPTPEEDVLSSDLWLRSVPERFALAREVLEVAVQAQALAVDTWHRLGETTATEASLVDGRGHFDLLSEFIAPVNILWAHYGQSQHRRVGVPWETKVQHSRMCGEMRTKD